MYFFKQTLLCSCQLYIIQLPNIYWTFMAKFILDKVTQDKQDPATWSSDRVSFRDHIQTSLIKIQIILMYNQYFLLIYVCLCAVSKSIVIPSLKYLLINVSFFLNNHLTWKSDFFLCESISCFCIKKTLKASYLTHSAVSH